MGPNHWSSTTFVFEIPSALSYGPSLENPSLIAWTLVSMPFGLSASPIYRLLIFDQVLAQGRTQGGRREKTKRLFFKLWIFLLRFVIPIVILVFITQFI